VHLGSCLSQVQAMPTALPPWWHAMHNAMHVGVECWSSGLCQEGTSACHCQQGLSVTASDLLPHFNMLL
jgi:hypothetical protein